MADGTAMGGPIGCLRDGAEMRPCCGSTRWLIEPSWGETAIGGDALGGRDGLAVDPSVEAKWDEAATREPEENAWGATRDVTAAGQVAGDVAAGGQLIIDSEKKHSSRGCMTGQSAKELAGEVRPELEPKDWTGDSSDDGSDDSGIGAPVAVRQGLQF